MLTFLDTLSTLPLYWSGMLVITLVVVPIAIIKAAFTSRKARK